MHLTDVNVQNAPPLPLLSNFTAVIAKYKLDLFTLSILVKLTALQIKGPLESSINVWFPCMYSQK
jgi:hypothetical protein